MRGAIEKRVGKNGTGYWVRVEYVADPVTGKRRQRSQTFPTKKAAEAALAKWGSEIDGGTMTDPSRMTVAELLNKWLDTVAAHKVRATTLAGYRATDENHVFPTLGSATVQ